MGNKINTSEPGEQSPEEHKSCPEDCPVIPKTKCPEDCAYWRCPLHDIDPETADDEKFHALRDEGKLDSFGRKNEEEEL